MTTKDKIKEQLKDDLILVQKIESLMTKVNIMDDNQKDMLLAGFSRNVMSHFLSINLLIERGLYNSAFALVRIFFENILKLKYMYYFMDDTKIKTIYTASNWNNHFPNIATMAKKLDEVHDIEFYTDIKQKAYKMMNDYTHTGPNQIARNFSQVEATVDSNFDDELILATLEGNNTLLKTTIVIFLAGIGLENGFISKEEMDAYLEY